ncbi:MAG: SRPBCC family protein [Candidatus Hydrogenedentes bacterium]|nr:SRPBCC family protein [Candidatus Hydrogenedentota bacterium]
MADSANTLRLHRVFKGPAERVYRAFLEPDALAKWLPPYGFTCKVHQMDARVGGTFRMAFTSFSKGNGHAFHGTYLELVPHERIVYTNEFDDPNLPGEMTVTVTLRKIICGTEMHIVQTGIPAAIPVEMCYLGWQESLAQLSRLVDAETPDNG